MSSNPQTKRFLAKLHIANIEKIVKFVRLSNIETYKL